MKKLLVLAFIAAMSSTVHADDAEDTQIGMGVLAAAYAACPATLMGEALIGIKPLMVAHITKAKNENGLLFTRGVESFKLIYEAVGLDATCVIVKGMFEKGFNEGLAGK